MTESLKERSSQGLSTRMREVLSEHTPWGEAVIECLRTEGEKTPVMIQSIPFWVLDSSVQPLSDPRENTALIEAIGAENYRRIQGRLRSEFTRIADKGAPWLEAIYQHDPDIGEARAAISQIVTPHKADTPGKVTKGEGIGVYQEEYRFRHEDPNVRGDQVELLRVLMRHLLERMMKYGVSIQRDLSGTSMLLTPQDTLVSLGEYDIANQEYSVVIERNGERMETRIGVKHIGMSLGERQRGADMFSTEDRRREYAALLMLDNYIGALAEYMTRAIERRKGKRTQTGVSLKTIEYLQHTLENPLRNMGITLSNPLTLTIGNYILLRVLLGEIDVQEIDRSWFDQATLSR